MNQIQRFVVENWGEYVRCMDSKKVFFFRFSCISDLRKIRGVRNVEDPKTKRIETFEKGELSKTILWARQPVIYKGELTVLAKLPKEKIEVAASENFSNQPIKILDSKLKEDTGYVYHLYKDSFGMSLVVKTQNRFVHKRINRIAKIIE